MIEGGFISVVTTINPPSVQLRKLALLTRHAFGKTFVIGDKKTPKPWYHPDIEFFSLEYQLSKGPFRNLAKALPISHYARKNLGYLYAMTEKSEWIFETDDDNLLEDSAIKIPRIEVSNLDTLLLNRGWVNVFDFLEIENHNHESEKMWPRGFPLELIKTNDTSSKPIKHSKELKMTTPIANGFVNGDPDVDAIFRLTRNLPIVFKNITRELVLANDSWSPFNSQNTWWHKSVFPLLYLPVTTSFRVTDILRSYVAQSIVQKFSMGIRFYGPSAIQDRNYHSLSEDFQQEIPLYLNSIDMFEKITKSISQAANIYQALELAYKQLYLSGYVKNFELHILKIWIDSVQELQQWSPNFNRTY
jgi:hypothetical protein